MSKRIGHATTRANFHEKSPSLQRKPATAALFTLDAVEVVGSEMADAGSLASGREAIEKRYAAHFASSPSKSSLKLVQVYAIGSEVCAISEFSRHRFRVGKGYQATIYVREADDWKIRMAYSN